MNRRHVLTLTLLALTACTPLAVTPPAAAPWAVRKAALSALDWTLIGRIGVTTETDGWHGTLRWTQTTDRYAIDLMGPLGQGAISIRGDAAGVSVRTQDGQTLTAADPEALLQEASGIRIPLAGLLYWVRGLPIPDQPSVLSGDEQGRLNRIEQDGWVVEYSEYTDVDGLALPERITARRSDVQVKLVINTWQPRPA